jgi:uncharacterized protein YidB (DUF937 family)
MGFLSNIMGAVLGKVGEQGGNAGAIANAVGGMLANDGGQGGLGGLVGKFQQAGMGDVIGSWVGKGNNLPISTEQLQSILGSDAVAGIAQKMGLNQGDALGQLSQMLPGLVDKLTPNGEAPAGGLGNMGELAGMLSGLLAKR